MTIKHCTVCGKAFLAETVRQKTCSPECRKVLNRVYRQKWKCDNYASLLSKEKTCEECGKTFTPEYANTKYCSPECKHAAAKRKNDVWKGYYKPRKRKSDDGLTTALREIKEYNEQHGTHLSYGQYQAMRYMRNE